MIQGGNLTLYVADVSRSVAFYTRVLGLRLRRRAEDAWAEVVAGPGLVIGLHHSDGKAAPPAAGFKIGLHVEFPIDQVVERLRGHGVDVEGPAHDDDSPVRVVDLQDPDGNPIYLFEYTGVAARG